MIIAPKMQKVLIWDSVSKNNRDQHTASCDKLSDSAISRVHHMLFSMR